MCFAVERMVDRIARELGLDRLDVRFRNFIQPDEFPYTTSSGDVYDSGDYPATLRLALEQIGYDALRRQQAAARAEGRWVGIGIATAVEPASTNFGYSRLVNQQAALTGVGEAARIRVEWDGKVSVSTGAADVPRIETGHLETPSPFTPLGTKGAGEGGAVPAPAAIASAVEDALAPLGVKVTSLPLTPSRLRDLVRAAEAARGG